VWRGALSLGLVTVSAMACADGTGLGAFGTVRVRAVFAPGEEPASLGVQVSDIRIVLRRDGGSGPVAVDTTLPFNDGATLAWVLELAAPPEPVGITAELASNGTVLYAGSDQTSVPEGLEPSGSVHDVLVRFVGSAVASVEVTPDSADLAAPGDTKQFHAVARDANGAAISGANFTWSSSHPAVATVDPATGLATAVGSGRTIITAVVDGVTGSAVLRVLSGGGGPVTSVEVSPPAGVITALGAALRFTAVARDAEGNLIPGVLFTWSSSSTGIATVDQTGQATGVAVGATTIRASAGGVSGTATLAVTQVAASIDVIPASITLGTGDTITFTAVARDAGGHVIPGAHFAWSASDPSIATMHASSGLATTVASGTVTVQARSGAATGSATLHVVDVAQVTVVPGGEPKVTVGGTVPFTAVVTDAAGNPVPGVRVIWSSADPAVASIHSASGLATGLAPGSSVISAAAGSVSGQAVLVVLPQGGGPPP
jgi:uncharacterized protein YjdB